MITERDGVPVTTSRAVAEQFGKKHFHVLRDIQSLMAELDKTEDGKAFNQSNFGLIYITDAMNRQKPAYILTRDGFTLLAMGFTGARALQFKIAYINAFNRMEQIIKGGSSPALQGIERRIEALEQHTGGTAPLAGEADIFLKAIKSAIASGEYYIKRKYEPSREKPGTLLGIRGRTETALKALTAYNIYAAYSAQPLRRVALWELLERCGMIAPRKSAPLEANFNGKRAGVIFLPLIL